MVNFSGGLKKFTQLFGLKERAKETIQPRISVNNSPGTIIINNQKTKLEQQRKFVKCPYCKSQKEKGKYCSQCGYGGTRLK